MIFIVWFQEEAAAEEGWVARAVFAKVAEAVFPEADGDAEEGGGFFRFLCGLSMECLSLYEAAWWLSPCNVVMLQYGLYQ